MAKEWICLGKSNSGSEDIYSLLLWIPVAAGRKAQANGSVWADASPAEDAAIQSGAVIEEQTSVALPAGLDLISNGTAVQAVFLQAWTIRAGQINNNGPAEYAGIYYDPTANPQVAQG